MEYEKKFRDLEDYRVGEIPSVYYIPDFLTERWIIEIVFLNNFTNFMVFNIKRRERFDYQCKLQLNQNTIIKENSILIIDL